METIAGSYGYRLDGALAGVPNAAAVGVMTLSPNQSNGGLLTGAEKFSLMGEYRSRTMAGTSRRKQLPGDRQVFGFLGRPDQVRI